MYICSADGGGILPEEVTMTTASSKGCDAEMMEKKKAHNARWVIRSCLNRNVHKSVMKRDCAASVGENQI